MHRGMYKTSGPAGHRQQQTSLWAHDKGVAQRIANGHVAVVGHGGQEHSLSTAQEVEEVELGQAPAERDGLMAKEKASQHLGNSDRRVENIQAGQVAKEEVHGCVESGLKYDHGHNGTIPQKTGQVEQQKGDEEEVLQPLDISEAQKDELTHLCLIQHCWNNKKQRQNVKVLQL